MGYKKSSKLIEKVEGKTENQYRHTELPDGEYNADQINARTAARLAAFEAQYQMHSQPGTSNNATPKQAKPVVTTKASDIANRPVKDTDKDGN